MKTLNDLRYEVELGLVVYPSTHHDVCVWFEDEWYHWWGTEEGVGTRDNWCETFEELLAVKLYLSSQPVWSTTKTPERLAYEKREIMEAENEKACNRPLDTDHPF